MVIIWLFTDDGFTSAVEFDPPTTRLVTPAKCIKPAKTRWDKSTKKTVVLEPGEWTEAVYETITPEYVEHLKDYHPAIQNSKDAEGKEIPGQLCSHLLVRARVEADLDELKKLDPNSYAFSDMSADYQFRLIIKRKAYAQYAYNKAMGIDYWSHVKETINKRAPQIQGGRYTGLSAVWSAIAKWQPNPPYGRTSTTYYSAGSGYVLGGDSYWGGKDTTRKWVVGANDPVTGKWIAGHYEDDDSVWISGHFDKETNKWIAGHYESLSNDSTDDPTDNSAPEHYLPALQQHETLGDLAGQISDDFDFAEHLSELGIGEEEWEFDVRNRRYSRATIKGQLIEHLSASQELHLFDLEDTIDRVIEAFGTVDLDGLETQDLWDVIEKDSKINEPFVEEVHSAH